MSKSRGERYTKEERSNLLKSYRESGKSVAVFSREAGIGYMTLRRWAGEGKGKLAEAQFIEVYANGAEPRGIRLRILLPEGMICESVEALGMAEAIELIRGLAGC
jgi:transposase-like protein